MSTRRAQLEQEDKSMLIDGYLLLEERVRTLEKQVHDLRQLLDKRLPKTPSNSSLPPSQQPKANRPPQVPAKRGPKAGHAGRSRQRQPPDELVECRVEQCAACGYELSALAQHEVGRHQVVDLPPLRPIVREVVRYGRYCPQCGGYQRAPAPAGFEVGRKVGRTLEQWVLYLHQAHPLSYQRVQHIVAEMTGLKLGIGTLVNSVARAQESAAQGAAVMQQQLRQAKVVGSDETGMRVGGSNHWQWVFQTPRLAYQVIRPSRSAQVLTEVLGDTCPEAWVSDVLSSQMCHPAPSYQICLAHQVRDLQYAMDVEGSGWAQAVQSLLYEALKLGAQREQEAAYAQRVQQLEARLDALLAQYPSGQESQRLWRRYRKHRQALFLFLARADVPPTNNASEQALRNSVIYRKVTGGFRTDWGAQLYANLLSLLETARRRGHTLFDMLADLFTPQPAFSWLGE